MRHRYNTFIYVYMPTYNTFCPQQNHPDCPQQNHQDYRLHTYVHTNIHTYTPTYIQTYIYIHTYVHTNYDYDYDYDSWGEALEEGEVSERLSAHEVRRALALLGLACIDFLLVVNRIARTKHC